MPPRHQPETDSFGEIINTIFSRMEGEIRIEFDSKDGSAKIKGRVRGFQSSLAAKETTGEQKTHAQHAQQGEPGQQAQEDEQSTYAKMQKRILELLKRERSPLKAEVICRKLGYLSDYDHVRQILRRLVRERAIGRTADLGYYYINESLASSVPASTSAPATAEQLPKLSLKEDEKEEIAAREIRERMRIEKEKEEIERRIQERGDEENEGDEDDRPRQQPEPANRLSWDIDEEDKDGEEDWDR